MPNTITIPYSNPVTFYQENVPSVAGKNFIHLDEDLFYKQIQPWEQKVCYCQKWQQTDTVNLQLQANFGPILLDLVGKYDEVIKTAPFVIKPTAIVGQPWKVYEVSMQLADVPSGYYYFRVSAGYGENIMSFRSEPQQIALKYPNTILHTYKDSLIYLDVIYPTGIVFNFRCECVIAEYAPGNESTVYTDQPRNTVVLSSTPFDTFKLYLGAGPGAPPWLAKKVNMIYGHDFVVADGRQYVRAEGAKLEVNREEKYPMAGWSMDILPASNRFSGIYDDTFENRVAVTYNINGPLFGITNTSTQDAQIIILERK